MKFVKKLIKLLFVVLFIGTVSYGRAQTAVKDRNINTLNVFNVDSAKRTVLPHRMQPASAGLATNHSDRALPKYPLPMFQPINRNNLQFLS